MGAQSDFAAYCMELLAPAGEVRSKRMFGGYGVYLDEVFVAMVAGDALYLKADHESRQCFEAAGGRRFEYTRQGKPQGAEFWTPPAEAMESPDHMRPWVQLAVTAALRARSGRRRALSQDLV